MDGVRPPTKSAAYVVDETDPQCSVPPFHQIWRFRLASRGRAPASRGQAACALCRLERLAAGR